MKQMMKYAAVVMGTLLLLFILWQFRLALLVLIASLFVAAMIRPMVGWLTDRGLSRGFAPLILYVIGLAVFVVVALLLGDQLLGEVNSAVNRAVVEYELLYNEWEDGAAWQQTAVNGLPEPFTLSDTDDMTVEDMLPAVMTLGRGLGGLLAGLLVLVAISIYWSADQYRFERLWLSVLPPQRRAYARDSWRAVESAVGGYLRSQAVESVLAALFIGLGAALAGAQYPLLLALLAGFGAFVPFFGALLTAVVAFGMGALNDLWLGAGLAVYVTLVFAALHRYVEPRLWQSRRHGFFLTVLLIIPLFEIAGLVGLIMTAPIAAALEVLIWQAYDLAVGRRSPVVELETLEARYHQLAERVAQVDGEEVTPELQSISRRLSELLAQAQSLGSAGYQ